MPTAVAWAVNYERFGALERLRGSAQGMSERPIGRLEPVRNARIIYVVRRCCQVPKGSLVGRQMSMLMPDLFASRH